MTTEQGRYTPFYRAIWRWHFWAGLIVAPFLMILALTGAIYLFNDELNDAFYPELRFVTPSATRAAASAMIGAALAAHPGAVSRIDVAADPARPAVVFVAPDAGPPLQVHVDPGSGRVLGSLDPDRTLVGWAEAMHGSLTIGTPGDRIVELAACWALVLIVTGVLLWWPRGRCAAGGVLWPRVGREGRRFWRDLHGPVGVWTAGLLAFLIVTGLPWAGIQGAVLQRLSTAAGVGYPDRFRTRNMPESVPMREALGPVPWTLEQAPMPRSPIPQRLHERAADAGHAGHDMAVPTADDAAVAGTDAAVAALRRHGLAGDYRLFLPAGPTGVYTALTAPDRPEGQRTIYLDRYTSRQIGPEVRFADYGWVGRATELGVAIHMGNYFGRANQLLMLVPCIGVWVLAVSGAVMWWKRRPRGRLGAPPRIAGTRLAGIGTVLVALAVALPLFGLSLAVLAAADVLARRLTRDRPRVTGQGR